MSSTNGIVIFAESVRWLNVPWGKATTKAGLRRAGFEGHFVYYRWHAPWQGCLVLPAIANRKLHEMQSKRLADFITRTKKRYPDRPVWLMGYSAGGYMAIRALEQLPPNVFVDGVCLFAAAFDSRHDLNCAATRVRGNIIVVSGVLDPIVSLGTLLFGTCDRKMAVSIGFCGYRGSPCSQVLSVRWNPSRILDGWWGEHFTVCAARLVANDICSILRIGK